MSDQTRLNLHDYLSDLPERSSRRLKPADPPRRVLDDWPEQVPVNRREVEVFAAYFGDILDDLFGLV
jgi:hypothetical protein